MNDFAKFFFMISGFFGFVLFFLVALIIHQDSSIALFHGALGCLLLSLSGRALLAFAIRSVVVRPGVSSRDQDSSPSVAKPNPAPSVLAQERITAEQMSEALADPTKPIVEAKV